MLINSLGLKGLNSFKIKRVWKRKLHVNMKVQLWKPALIRMSSSSLIN